MKFSLVRPALVLAVSLTLASCGGGGKATYPINVSVSNLQYDGLTMSTNGMDYTVQKPASPTTPATFTFPNQIEYGQQYNVVVKTQPAHQTCSPSLTYPTNLLPKGTAGQLARIQVYYDCVINTYALSGTVTGLTTGTSVVLTNGSNGSVTVTAAADGTSNPISFAMAKVPYGSSFGVSVLTQPAGLNCTVTGGNGSDNNGSGVMNDAAEGAGGVTNLLVSCVPATAP